MGISADLGPTLTIVVAVAIGVTTLAVLLRCYVRLILQHRFTADDSLIVFSQVNFCAFSYCVLHEVKYGVGKHLVEILTKTPTDLPKAMKVRPPFFLNFPFCSQGHLVLTSFSNSIGG
jgi:hypothetical protein